MATDSIKFALNHMVAPKVSARVLIDLAASLGCYGVELRNDLADKGLTGRPFFDDEEPAAIGDYALKQGIKILGLSEVYGFNNWSDEIQRQIEKLITQASECGAASISLIPSNDGEQDEDAARLEKLTGALIKILPLLEDVDMIALIEPLGFTTSSLRQKSEALAAIDDVSGENRFKLVHDTFHHHLAKETEFFPKRTGIVHISAVIDETLSRSEMRDDHRILFNENDRLGSIAQIKALLDQGYEGAFSFEPFS